MAWPLPSRRCVVIAVVLSWWLVIDRFDMPACGPLKLGGVASFPCLCIISSQLIITLTRRRVTPLQVANGVNIGDSLFDEEGAKIVPDIMKKAAEKVSDATQLMLLLSRISTSYS